MQFDMIYHEHQYYYSLIALQNFLKQFDMEVFDVKRIPVRGGSIQFFIQNMQSKKRRSVTAAVKKLASEEREQGFDTVQRYKVYAKQVERVKKNLVSLLDTLKQKGIELVGEIQAYEDSYKLCYVRGPEGIIVELAEQL